MLGKDKKDEKLLPSWGCAACVVHLWEPNHPLHKSLKCTNSPPGTDACEAAVWKVPEWWMCLDIWELPTDGAQLNDFSTKHGDSVINCSGTWPHVRELEYMRERINEQLINVLWLNNIQNWLATASLLFLLCEELRHSWVVLIYLKAAWPNPISLRKLHDIIMCPKVHFT